MLGDAYLVDLAAVGLHLCIVLSNEDDERRVVLVSVSTWRARCENTCVLHPGDHPFIQHESTVRYDKARIVSVPFLLAYAKRRESLAPEVLDRVLRGASQSLQMPMGPQEMLREQGLIE